MKIVFTGGGTGGHFYPIIAVAERVNKIIDQENIIGAKLYYISDDPYDKEVLFEHGLLYEEVNTGRGARIYLLKTFSIFLKFSSEPLTQFLNYLQSIRMLFSVKEDMLHFRQFLPREYFVFLW